MSEFKKTNAVAQPVKVVEDSLFQERVAQVRLALTQAGWRKGIDGGVSLQNMDGTFAVSFKPIQVGSDANVVGGAWKILGIDEESGSWKSVAELPDDLTKTPMQLAGLLADRVLKEKMSVHYSFNDQSAGIFADGYEDRDGLPVGDTFAYRLRAQLHGAAARDWTKEQNAALVASYSSAEMNEIMNGVEKIITEGANLDVLTANLDRSDLWDGFGNSGMRHMEECDLIGGETDCYPSRYPCYPSTATNALPHEMTFAEFAKIARVEKLENHGRQSEVFIGDKSLGFCDFPGGDDALRQAHAREINNAIYVNAPEAADFMEKVSFPPAHVLAEYPKLMEVWADVLKGREPEVHSKAWFDACFKGDTPPQDLRDFSESFVKKYGVKGICDPMYIVNVTAFELGCGDGRGKFTEGRECPPEKFNRVADRLLFSYSANIQNTSLLTTQEDVTGLLKSAIEAGELAAIAEAGQVASQKNVVEYVSSMPIDRDCTGKVMCVNDHYTVISLGRNALVCPNKVLSLVPANGADVTISFKGGVGEVVVKDKVHSANVER